MATTFQKIISGELPSYKVYEDEKNYAFLDINPEVRGHVLIVPKNPVDKLYDLPEEDYVSLMLAAKKLASHMDEVLDLRIIWKVVGVDVPHAHIHLMPFDETWTPGRVLKFTDDEMESIRKQLSMI